MNKRTFLIILAFGLFVGAMWQDEMATIVLVNGDTWYDFPSQFLRVDNTGVKIWLVKDFWRATQIACFIFAIYMGGKTNEQ